MFKLMILLADSYPNPLTIRIMHSLYPLAERMKTYNLECVRVANEACARASELSSSICNYQLEGR